MHPISGRAMVYTSKSKALFFVPSLLQERKVLGFDDHRLQVKGNMAWDLEFEFVIC